MTKTRHTLRGLSALALLAAAMPAAAQRAPADSGAFVARIGSDTVAVERYSRVGDRLWGQVVSRAPRTTVRSYTATLRPDGSVSHYELTVGPASGPPVARAVADFGGDSATVRVTRDTTTTNLRVATPAVTLPQLTYSFGLYEQAAAVARRTGRDSVDLAILPMGARQALPLTVRRVRADSVIMTDFEGLHRVRFDARGRLTRLDGTESTDKVLVDRLPTLDVMRIASAWTAADAGGRAMGQLSPRDTVRASVGGANLLVDYGRPSRRGRAIVGGVVPYGEVWRTGANAATQFRTDHDLVMGGATVPAGTYTLWTLPSPTGWKLIVNKETGQWGTEYHGEQDLVRVDLPSRSVSGEPVERFTIAIDPAAAGGVLRMMWDTTELALPFTVR
ncbi:MAG TPA: DUF2911 domain-containing protein [Longimicrobiaceae bacterium]|jgi:hypothetical protein|nr:DUF2911 domain-containing protein [Longimicrobiaceae bacterium]